MTEGLRGKRILIVEDEFIVAAMAEDSLMDLGAVIVGPAYRLAEGVRLAQTEAVDAALLDVNLGGERSDGVAAALRERGVPIVFATGYGEAMAGFGARVLDKPYTRDMLVAALTEALERTA